MSETSALRRENLSVDIGVSDLLRLFLHAVKEEVAA